MIDYALAKKQGPKLKAALTRAKNVKDPHARWDATKNACSKAVAAWRQWGAWPDGWALWQVTLDDAYTKYAHSGMYHGDLPDHRLRLEEL